MNKQNLAFLISVLVTFSPFSPSLAVNSQTYSVQQSFEQGSFVKLGSNYFRASIDERRFKYLSAPESVGRQRQSNWCWAASIQMVLNYHGIPISQEEIVRNTFGNTINLPASGLDILKTFNNWFIDRSLSLIKPNTVLIEPDEMSLFVQLISTGHPIIIAQSGESETAPGHARVAKSVDFSIAPSGAIQIHSVILSDPWPQYPVEVKKAWSEILRTQRGFFSIY